MTTITSYPTLSTISAVFATSGPQLNGRVMLETVLKPTHLLTEQTSCSPTYMLSSQPETGDDSVSGKCPTWPESLWPFGSLFTIPPMPTVYLASPLAPYIPCLSACSVIFSSFILTPPSPLGWPSPKLPPLSWQTLSDFFHPKGSLSQPTASPSCRVLTIPASFLLTPFLLHSLKSWFHHHESMRITSSVCVPMSKSKSNGLFCTVVHPPALMMSDSARHFHHFCILDHQGLVPFLPVFVGCLSFLYQLFLLL